MNYLIILVLGMLFSGLSAIATLYEIPEWIIYTLLYLGLLGFVIGGFGIALF